MGHKEARVYLASPLTVAASALTGDDHRPARVRGVKRGRQARLGTEVAWTANSINPQSVENGLPFRRSDAEGRRTNPWRTVVPLEELITDEDDPVDNIYIEKHRRLMPELSMTPGPAPAPAGFPGLRQRRPVPRSRRTVLSPDVMLGVDVAVGGRLEQEGEPLLVRLDHRQSARRGHRNRLRPRGGEGDVKFKTYARLGIPITSSTTRPTGLVRGCCVPSSCTTGSYAPARKHWFPAVDLGLTLWTGTYEECEDEWLRWCDAKGVVIPTGTERAEEEKRRAERREQRQQASPAGTRQADARPGGQAGRRRAAAAAATGSELRKLGIDCRIRS